MTAPSAPRQQEATRGWHAHANRIVSFNSFRIISHISLLMKRNDIKWDQVRKGEDHGH